MPVWIRPAISADADAIAAVQIEAWRAAYRGLLPDAMIDGLDVARRADFFRARLGENRGRFSVAEQDGAIAGYCDLVPSRDADAAPGDVGEIAAIYIRPPYWRHGIGRALCLDAVSWCRTQGFRILTLWVLATNQGAQRFYSSMGFTPDGARKTDHIANGIDFPEVRLRLEIGSIS